MDIMQTFGFLCSVLIGVSLGLIGGGGSILTLPVMVYLLGINPMLSTAYSLFVVGVTSLIGSLHYMQKRLINYRAAAVFSVPSFLSVFFTRTYVMQVIPDPVLVTENFIISKDVAIMVFLALLMLVASLSMIGGRKANPCKTHELVSLNYPMIILAGTLVGLLTAIVGAGGGFLIIPAFVLLARLPMKVAVGTSLLVIAAKSLIGFLGDLSTTQIHWPFLLPFTALAVAGIWAGSYLSRFISGDKLKKGFGYFVLVMSVYMLIKESMPLTTAPEQAIIQPQAATFSQISWQAPDMGEADRRDSNLIRYGRDLIANTSYYLGPKGKVATISNGMNCQNCHLDAGTKLWGNNYSAVAATYPKFRQRSGTTETVIKRISDCFERSLNGSAPDSASREMQAMVAYLKFVGKDVPKGEKPEGAGIRPLPLLGRAADPAKGKILYEQKCVTCHGRNGQGKFKEDRTGYIYPPLWGEHSYNTSAGLYRLSRMAGFIKANMPLGVTWQTPQLSDEEAWDLAAYINTRPRPVKQFNQDWPELKGKPYDHPFGPYADPFDEQQHKFGPYEPIIQYKKSL